MQEANTSGVQYEIIGDTVDTNRPGTVVLDTSSPSRVESAPSLANLELKAAQMAMLRRLVMREQRRQLRAQSRANQKAKNRTKRKMAEASRKRNR